MEIYMTKKYAAVYQPLIERVQAETEKGHKKTNDRDKALKTKLHQLYGAYTQENAHKKATAIISALEESAATQAWVASASLRNNDESEFAATSLLSLHASTKERLLNYVGFYDFILSNTGPLESILDIGCGYNPFSIPLIPGAVNLNAYHAYDIDTRVADLLNRFFACLSLPPLAKCADLAVHPLLPQADIALMCKLIPVLEAQSPGSGFRLARELNTRYLLITYPLKSLSGREKGMATHYTAAFERALADGELGRFALTGQSRVGGEILYLLVAS